MSCFEKRCFNTTFEGKTWIPKFNSFVTEFSPDVLVQSSTEQMEEPPPQPTTNPDLELFPTTSDFLLPVPPPPLLPTSSSSRMSMRCVMKWFV